MRMRVTKAFIATLLAGALGACTQQPPPADGDPLGQKTGSADADGDYRSSEDAPGEVGYRSMEEALADVAEMYGIQDPPEVEPVREITPAESKEVIDQCLADRGWPVEDGHIQFTSDQRDSLDMDSYICTAMYPIRQEYLEPLDEAAWGRIYDYWVSETIPCLRAEGLDVAEPPTKVTFVASRSWTPDNDHVRSQVEKRVAEGDYADAEHVFTAVCPVTPPPEVRLGTS
jgi:hypothetical protein